MTTQEKPLIRLFVAQDFLPGAQITLDEKQSHYLHNVMRLRERDVFAVFNGTQGEWLATIAHISKRAMTLMIGKERKPFQSATDVWLAFAMIKNKSELLVEKATELGVAKILPFVAQHGVVKNINMEKLEAHAVEAAEQCERHDVPELVPYKNLGLLLGDLPSDRILLYGDETGGGKNLNDVISQGGGKFCILIGPEGGFSASEFQMLRVMENAKPFGMGPRILRADTAAVAALACVQMLQGDWHIAPHFKALS